MRSSCVVALLVIVLAVAGCGGESPGTAPPVEAEPTTEAQPPAEPEPPVESEAPPPAETQPPPATEATPAPEPPAPVPPPTVPMSWKGAGAFVWHESDLSPEALAEELLGAGFGWVALFLHDGMAEDPVEGDWVRRFRLASGLPVGGWGALRTQPVEEAGLAHTLLDRNGLDFYIANAEAEYDYAGPSGPSDERGARSRAFVDAFRRFRPHMPAGLSSYCRPDRHDLDWAAWSAGGFVFLPQAYVNDFGAEVTPAACVRAARGFFPAGFVHPTIGMYPGVTSSLRAERYARLLDHASTVGFSVYLAETRMTGAEWSALGQAIVERGIARLPAAS